MTPLSPIAGQLPATTNPGIAGALVVPADFQAQLDQAVAEGSKDAATFAGEHTPSERWLVPQWALSKMAWPPKDDTPELAQLHQIARTRTPAGVAAAREWSTHGLDATWEQVLEEYTRGASPAAARAARKLLHDALMSVNNITQVAKAASGRQRPFTVDPSLPLAVDKPGNSPSHPSGHTSAAFAAAMVLAHLMPDRRAEFMGLAGEASWARIYAGVHFPSDVVAGAKLASTVTSYLTSVSLAPPRAGTAGHNTGVAGTRRALAGAAKLAGPAIQGGGVLDLARDPLPDGAAA